MNTHPEQWTAMLQRPGSSWGFGVLLKDTSVVVLNEDTPPTNNPCQTWDSNPNLPLTSPTRYPLGHDCPMDWSGVDYLWIIVMFLSAVWTLILTAPIHCRASIGADWIWTVDFCQLLLVSCSTWMSWSVKWLWAVRAVTRLSLSSLLWHCTHLHF